jgi:hypothetical protein
MIPTNVSSRFGKHVEHFVISSMLKEGLDVYLPVMDNNGVDMVVKRPDGHFAEVQIKARSKEAKIPAFFPKVQHHLPKPRFWYVFYVARFEAILLLSSLEFHLLTAVSPPQRKRPFRQIRFDGRTKGVPCIQSKYQKYVATDFSRIVHED